MCKILIVFPPRTAASWLKPRMNNIDTKTTVHTECTLHEIIEGTVFA